MVLAMLFIIVELFASIYIIHPAVAGEVARISNSIDGTACGAGGTTIDFSIRSDFNNIGPEICPGNEFFSQRGATVSLSHNYYTTQWSETLNGLAALSIRHYGNGSLFLGYAVGPYLQGVGSDLNDPTHTQARWSDTLTAGAFLQFGFSNQLVPDGAGQDWFRLRGGEVYASSTARSSSFVGEWLPVYDFSKFSDFHLPLIGQEAGLPGTQLYYIFLPEVMVQYDKFDGGAKTSLLFGHHNDALRIGPQFIERLYFGRNQVISPNAQFDHFLHQFFLLATSHFATDVNSGRQYIWNAVSLNYNFTSNVGASISYGHGNLETIGTKANQLMIGLSAKY
jgi:hypothetical protein